MKRDARIGLAVVLVLGLLVTLLVGRALLKHGGPANEPEADVASADSAASTSADARHVDGADASGAVKAAASVPAPGSQPTAHPSTESGARLPDAGNQAVQKFVDDQTRNVAMQNPTLNQNPGFKGTPGVPDAPAKPPTGPIDPHHGAITPEQMSAIDHESGPPSMMKSSKAETSSASETYAYTVASGDNMWKISSKVFGDGKYTQKIIAANSGLNVQKVKPGMVIKIPSIPNKTMLVKLPTFDDLNKPAKKSAPAAPEEPSVEGHDAPVPLDINAPASAEKKDDKPAFKGATHKVESGETVSSIARKYYGVSGPKSVQKIISANHGLDPAKLKVGQELTIPQ